ncbi:MAG TPA: glycoside hydrolase family 97 C-terminal domain-containing protein, partial [Bacteroidota bacterium]|nr:glycoside hydrolase family 97 C-terminal domain-containing protein [Bacteroidota bacterium]
AKGKDEWYLGAITDEHPRTATAPLRFLDPRRTYIATIYADAPDAHWEKNPMAYRIDRYAVNASTVLTLKLAPGGGAAVSIKPAGENELRNIPRYR